MNADAADPIALHVLGVPAPQGSKTAVSRGGHARVINAGTADSRRRLADWRHDVHAAAAAHHDTHGIRLDEPVHIEAWFRFDRPKSAPKWRWLRSTKPDLDKLLRSTLDGLTPILVEDSRVVAITACKTLCEPGEAPGVTLLVWPLGEFERAGTVDEGWIRPSHRMFALRSTQLTRGAHPK